MRGIFESPTTLQRLSSVETHEVKRDLKHVNEEIYAYSCAYGIKMHGIVIGSRIIYQST